jgi:hypothetical protein
MRHITATPSLRIGAALLLLSCAPTALVAQSDSDFSAYNALVLTPTGGLPPLLIPAMLTGASSPHLALRVGRIDPWGRDDDRFTNLAAGLELPLGARTAIGLTAGVLNSNCDECDPELLLGLSATGSLASYPFGTGNGGAAFTVGLQGEAGWTRFEFGTGHITALSGATGVPLALSSRGSGAQVALFVTPALGYGRVSVLGESESGTRPLLGGGVAVSAGAATLNLGFKKVFIENGRTLLGAGAALRLGGRT